MAEGGGGGGNESRPLKVEERAIKAKKDDFWLVRNKLAQIRDLEPQLLKAWVERITLEPIPNILIALLQKKAAFDKQYDEFEFGEFSEKINKLQKNLAARIINCLIEILDEEVRGLEKSLVS